MQESRAQGFIFQVGKAVDEILLQELGSAARGLDCQLDVRLREDLGQVRLRRDHDIGRLVLDHDDAADAVLDRSVFAFRVNTDIDGAGVGHRIAVVDREVVDEEELLPDRGLEETEIDDGARAELGEIEFGQSIVEAAQAGNLGVDGEAGVFVDAAVVFVEAERGRLERARGKVATDVFFRDDVELGVRFEGGGRLGRRFRFWGR